MIVFENSPLRDRGVFVCECEAAEVWDNIDDSGTIEGLTEGDGATRKGCHVKLINSGKSSVSERRCETPSN